jgi:LmeA-like phospholipid-binding
VVKKAAIVLVVLIGLLVAIDFGTAAAAEYQVSKRLRGHLDLPEDPAVRINGFPFLLQAFSGNYREVEVSADGVTVARLRNLGVEATLHHVRVPFSDLVSGSADTVRIDEVVGRVRVQAAELEKLIGVDDLQVEEVTDRDRNAAGQQLPDNAVKLIGTTDLDGKPVRVTVIASLELIDGLVQIEAHTVSVNDRTLPPVVEQNMLRLFTVRLDPGTLPFTVTPTSVHADDKALVVEGTARDIVLNTTGATR